MLQRPQTRYLPGDALTEILSEPLWVACLHLETSKRIQPHHEKPRTHQFKGRQCITAIYSRDGGCSGHC